MYQELWSQDLDSLKQMYASESKKLVEALLQGADWEEVEDKRKLVTQLSVVIDRKKEGINFNPAENSIR
jgi:hypothetical protein